MRIKLLVILFVALAFSWAAKETQAGTIRYAGNKIAQGSTAVAQATADGAQAAGGGMAKAGKATGGGLKSGVIASGKGVAATPGIVARGTKATGKAIWKTIW